PRRPGEVGLYLMIAISDSLEEGDVVARLERDDRLLDARPLAGEPADALDLAARHDGADVGHGDLEQRRDRVRDLDLVRVLGALERARVRVLGARGGRRRRAAGLAKTRALLGEERALDDRLRSAHVP